MQLPNDTELKRESIEKAGLLILAVGLNAVEYFLPRIPFLPWLKPGLANCVTLVWIIRYGFTESIILSLLRIWIVTFYFGFSFITVALSASGSIFACSLMALFWHVLGKRRIAGTVGVAVIGAFSHNIGQLVMVYFLLARNFHLFYQVPFMIAASVVFGTIVGIITPTLMRIVAYSDESDLYEKSLASFTSFTIKRSHAFVSLLFFMVCLALVFINNQMILVVTALGITIVVQILMRGSTKALVYPLTRFWLLFLFIGAFHLFFSYGERIRGVPFITTEGIHLAVVQWLRLWAWLQTTFIFFHFQFHKAALIALKKILPMHHSAFYGGMLALELFPQTIAMVRKDVKPLLQSLFRSPTRFVEEIYRNIVCKIIGNQTFSV